MKFILLINVKMSTTAVVDILTFISRINDWLWLSKPETTIDFDYFNIFEYFKFHAQLS